MENKELFEKSTKVIERAEELNVLVSDQLSHRMDIECANEVFNIDFDRWLQADDFNFTHDFLGIYKNIDRQKARAYFLDKNQPITEEVFNFFVPRFAGKK